MRGESGTEGSALAQSFRFVRQYYLSVLIISAVLLTPCVWHHHIEAGDLGSHLYNAWLVQQIQHGQAPGLYVIPKGENVLFDLTLSGLSSIFGFKLAELLAVSAAALAFFWGVFALFCAASRRIAWTLLPCIAILTYGWTFHAGLFNYYISLGLSFLLIAMFWRGKPWERLLALALAPLVLLAHPLGLAFFLGTALCVWIAEKIAPRYRVVLPVSVGAFLLLVHHYIAQHLKIISPVWMDYLINGSDQIVIFGQRYNYLAAGTLFFGLVCLVTEIASRKGERRFGILSSIPFQLYLCAQMGIFLLPSGIYLPQYGAPLSMLLERLSLISATMACCVLALIRPRAWHAIGFSAFAVVFFVFLYQDTGFLSHMEDRVDQLVETLPPGQRVMETITTDPDWRGYVADHMLDRACIGRCFAYGNYEASSNQFRVHAEPGNRIVMTSYEDTESMEEGTYQVKEKDLPAYQVYQCSLSVSDLCIRKLTAGETNNRLGMHPEGVPH